MMSAPLLLADRVSKRFAGTQALDDVSFALEAGEIHALVGENGAGKSTLIKIFGGVHAPDAGAVAVAGGEGRFRSPRDALAAGIVVIPQEVRVAPALSVAANVTLGDLPTRRVFGVLPALDERRMAEQASAPRAQLSLDIAPLMPAGRLGIAERQLVTIARALARQARVLILDEPTASLEAREVARLFGVLAGLKAKRAGLVFVTHRLDEVMRIADRCTVLRDGRAVGTFARHELDLDGIVQLMTGRDLGERHRPQARAPGPALLEFASPGSAEPAALREREVVGLAGLLGSGTTELLRRLFGAHGSVPLKLRGRETTLRSPADAIAAGVGFVPGERGQALAMNLTVRENIVLPNLDRLAGRWRLNRVAVERLVERLMTELDIRPREPGKRLSELSGGNQQKVAFARWLAGNAALLLLDEPTHGIDVGAKAAIHRLMREFAENGGAIALASSEFEEILAVSDRVLAMRQGALAAELRRDGDYSERALRRALGS